MPDVRLEDDSVVVDGNYLKVGAHDLWLDSSSRHGDMGLTYRRALVHDFDDALALNYVGDYPGGVRIFGPVSMERGPLTVERLKVEDGLIVSAEAVEAPSPISAPALPSAPASVESLTETLGSRLRDGLLGAISPAEPPSEVTLSVDRLVRQLFELQRQVAELTARVQALESR